jgi:hypothetical protein
VPVEKLSEKIRKKYFFLTLKSMKKVVGSGVGAGSGSGSISQRYRSGDPNPDPHQNVTDPQHWLLIWSVPTAYINT